MLTFIPKLPFFATIVQPGKAAVWHKADLHLHTTYSDGLMTSEETVDIIAQHTSLRVIAITDHDTTEGAFVAREYAQQRQPGIEVVIGQEVTTGDGDVIGLYLQSTLPRFATAAEAIEAIHRQGGLAVAVHPFTFGWGMESIQLAFLRLPFDAVEVRHGCPVSLVGNLCTTLLNLSGPQLPGLGGSDSHIPYTAGQAFTWFPGSSSSDLRRAIETHTVRAGGTTWKLVSLWRTLLVIAERGWPTYTNSPDLAHSTEAIPLSPHISTQEM